MRYVLSYILAGYCTLIAQCSQAQSEKIDILSCNLELTIPLEYEDWRIASNSLTGKATIQLYLPDSLDTISFLLHRLMKVDGVQLKDGEDLTFYQSVVGLTAWESFQLNHIRLVVPGKYMDTLSFTLYYHGYLTGYEETGMLYVKETLDPRFTIIRPESFSYPQLSEPSETSLMTRWRGGDSFIQELSVTLPDGHFPAVAGKVESQDEDNNMVTHKWMQRGSSIIIPISPYKLMEEQSYSVYYFPEDSLGAYRIQEGIDQAFKQYQNWMGPLQENVRFTLAEIPEDYGSQVAMPLIIQTATSFKDKKAMGELYHEMAHFWNVKDTDVKSNRWNEGMAMYLQYITYDVLDEPGSYEPAMNNRLEQVKGYFKENPEKIAMTDYGRKGVTSPLSYSAGALFFYVLENKIGRERLLKGLGEFYGKYYHTGASIDDFQTFMIGYDKRTRPVFQDWYSGTDYVEQILKAASVKDLASHYQD